jgi:hypothetical protein
VSLICRLPRIRFSYVARCEESDVPGATDDARLYLPGLWCRPACWLGGPVRPLLPASTLRLLAARARPLRVAAAAASGEAARRKPLHPLRL